MKAIYVLAIAAAAIFIGAASAANMPFKNLGTGGFADYLTTITDATSAHTGDVPASAWAWQTGTAEADSLDTGTSTIKDGYTDTDTAFTVNAQNQFKKDPSASAGDSSDSISATNGAVAPGGFSINPDGTLHGTQTVDEGAAATTSSIGLLGIPLANAQGIKWAEVLVAGASQTNANEFAGTSNAQSEAFGGVEADW